MSHLATLDPHKVANRVCLQQADAGLAGTGTRDTVVCGSIMVTYCWMSPSTPLIVNGADGVVIEGRGCLGLLHEPLLRIVVSGQLRREEFERNRAFELGVQGRIHDTHSAATKLL